MSKRGFILTAVSMLSVFFCGCKPRDNSLSQLNETSQNPAPSIDRRYAKLGAKADCADSSIGNLDYSKFVTLTQSIPTSVADRQQAVLDQLQKLGELQTFTINFESESAQSPGISGQFPGVIRMRQDGKLIIRYTCDRGAETYGNFEVIAFDSVQRRFQFTSIDMQNPKPEERVHSNPDLCFGCHDYGGDDKGDLRPNWNMYPEWKGMFGSHDDFFPAGTPNEVLDVGHARGWLPPNRTDELQAFEAFMNTKVFPQIGKPDPCYATLPWLKATPTQSVPKIFERWPYGMTNGSARKRVYATRPNLKFTEVMSKLLALRNYRRLVDEPKFRGVEHLLAAEAAYCTEPSFELGKSGVPPISRQELDQMLAKALPGYQRPDDKEARPVDLRGTPMTHHDLRHSSSRAQALFGVWRALGWSGGEWTMVPFEYEHTQYETGAGPGENRAFPADLPLSAYVQHEILAGLSASQPDLKLQGKFAKARGEAADFGEHFACIDEVAGPSVFSSEKQWSEVCQALIDEARVRDQLNSGTRSRGGLQPGTRSIPKPPRVPRFDPRKESLEAYLARVNQALKKRGEFHYGE